MAGPEEAVRRACASVNLFESTHTTGRSDLEIIGAAAEVLNSEQADAYVRQAISILEDQHRYAKRVRPTFVIHTYVFQMIHALLDDSGCALVSEDGAAGYQQHRPEGA